MGQFWRTYTRWEVIESALRWVPVVSFLGLRFVRPELFSTWRGYAVAILGCICFWVLIGVWDYRRRRRSDEIV
jgi:hypothetical protein